jgi:hypothetical protein
MHTGGEPSIEEVAIECQGIYSPGPVASLKNVTEGWDILVNVAS